MVRRQQPIDLAVTATVGRPLEGVTVLGGFLSGQLLQNKVAHPRPSFGVFRTFVYLQVLQIVAGSGSLGRQSEPSEEALQLFFACCECSVQVLFNAAFGQQ